MKQIILIFLISFLISCGQTEIKKVIDRFNNGKERNVFFYKDEYDTLSYRKETFYKSGKRNYTGNILKNQKEGIWTWWYENGNKKDQCKYAEGFYVDTVYHWYENGKLKQIEIIEDRKVRTDGCCNCNGVIFRYNQNGELIEKFTAIDDQLQGERTTYEENGSWKMRTYRNDTLNGATIEHFVDSNGLQIIVGQYINDLENGEWKWYDKDSILTQTGIYKNGKLLKVNRIKNKNAEAQNMPRER